MAEYIVSTSTGKVRGYEREGRIEYLGIPYAAPPVGKLRFKRAQPVQPWDRILDAAAYGEPAVQFNGGKAIGSEDCLTVNVQRPVEGENLPVFIWIHGGGYNTGMASDVLSDGKAFARDGVLFFSFQYRMNVLGFYDFTSYPGCEAFESNCGLSDQIEAITWIHDNIEAFGGDPERVTIAGESAGGASVINMLAVPKVRGFFQQAIAESGLPNCVSSHTMARQNIDLYLEGMGWTEADIPKLLTMDPYDMLPGNEYVAKMHQYKNPGIFLPSPVIDDLLPERPIEAIRKGSAAGVKLIIGTNHDEGTMFVRPEDTNFPNSWEMVRVMLEHNDHEENFEAIRQYYGRKMPALDPFIDFASDYAFRMPAIKVAEAQRAHGPVWMYRYDLVTKSGAKTGMKASHAFELPSVFDCDRTVPFIAFQFEGESEELVDAQTREIHGDWVRFVKDGAPDEANWPQYGGYDSEIRIFDRTPRTEAVNCRDLMELWGDMRFYEK